MTISIPPRVAGSVEQQDNRNWSCKKAMRAKKCKTAGAFFNKRFLHLLTFISYTAKLTIVVWRLCLISIQCILKTPGRVVSAVTCGRTKESSKQLLLYAAFETDRVSSWIGQAKAAIIALIQDLGRCEGPPSDSVHQLPRSTVRVEGNGQFQIARHGWLTVALSHGVELESGYWTLAKENQLCKHGFSSSLGP